MSNGLQSLFELRESIERFEQELGIANLNDLEKSILEFIVSSKDVTVTMITQTEYFQRYSFSSIKRAVNNLINSDFIFQEVSKDDRRARFLIYKN